MVEEAAGETLRQAAVVAAAAAAAAGTAAERASARPFRRRERAPGSRPRDVKRPPPPSNNAEHRTNRHPLRPPPRPRVTIDVTPPGPTTTTGGASFRLRKSTPGTPSTWSACACDTAREAARRRLARHHGRMTRPRRSPPRPRREARTPGVRGARPGKRRRIPRAAVFTRLRGPRPEEQEFRRRGGRAVRDVARARGTRGRLDAARRFVRHDQSRDALDRGVHVEFLRARRVVIDRGIETTPNERGVEETRRRGVVHVRAILAPSVRFVRSRGILAPPLIFVLARSVERATAHSDPSSARLVPRSRVPGRAYAARTARA